LWIGLVLTPCPVRPHVGFPHRPLRGRTMCGRVMIEGLVSRLRLLTGNTGLSTSTLEPRILREGALSELGALSSSPLNQPPSIITCLSCSHYTTANGNGREAKGSPDGVPDSSVAGVASTPCRRRWKDAVQWWLVQASSVFSLSQRQQKGRSSFCERCAYVPWREAFPLRR